MKLLCDVCEQNVASLVCCADEAALCPSCDLRVHAANKLASKHQRVPLLSDTSSPALCDICQERSSFFFCVEDRALLCRECDVSIHSANALAAKHRRFLLTGIKVSMTPSNGHHQKGSSSEPPHVSQQTSPAVMSNAGPAPTKPQKQSSDSITFVDNLGGKSSVSSPQVQRKSVIPSPEATKRSSSYVITKDGTLSTSSSILNSARGKRAAVSSNNGNSTTISIQRLSVGSVPFVAPVLSSFISVGRTQEDRNSNKSHYVNSNNYNDNQMDNNYNSIINNKSSNNSFNISLKNSSSNGNANDNDSSSNIMPDLDASSPKAGMSDYLTTDVPGWKLDELLTDLVDACESGRSTQPPKESITLGFGHDDRDHPWLAELDFFEEPDQLSSSQDEGVALVPEMPSPPTTSGLITTRAKSTLPWAFDYLFDGPQQEPNDVSVVPDIGGGRYSPTSSESKASKKRKYWMDIGSGSDV